MSEVLTEIFSLRATPGETLKAWISRASELFDRCQRKVSVSFPEEARGWLILHRSGLSEEQKAVCLARSQGVLKREDIGKAMRSCYPDYTAKASKMAHVSLVETDHPEDDQDVADADLTMDEVELFLAEHDMSLPLDDDEVYTEQDVAEEFVCHLEGS